MKLILRGEKNDEEKRKKEMVLFRRRGEGNEVEEGRVIDYSHYRRRVKRLMRNFSNER